MAKRNAIEPENQRGVPDREVKPAPAMAEGYTWCLTCQAAYEGEVCPGCVDLSGANVQPALAAEETEGCGPCAVCQAETTYSGEHNGDYPVWLCPDHGGEAPKVQAGEEGPVPEASVCETCGATYLADKCPMCGEGTAPPDPTTLAEVAAALPDEETTTVTEILPVTLTDAEHKEISQRMAAANQEIVQVEIDLKALKTQYKSRKESAEARRNECSDIINAGHQPKSVECRLIKNFRENTITVIRLDVLGIGDAVVRTRTMTNAERQRLLLSTEE